MASVMTAHLGDWELRTSSMSPGQFWKLDINGCKGGPVSTCGLLSAFSHPACVSAMVSRSHEPSSASKGLTLFFPSA